MEVVAKIGTADVEGTVTSSQTGVIVALQSNLVQGKVGADARKA